MIFKDSDLNYKILTILILSGLLLILSCQSDPIVGLNNLNGDDLKHTNLKLRQSLSITVQEDNQTDESPRLYAGILDNGDTASALINIQSELLNSHQVCNSDGIGKFKIIGNVGIFIISIVII